MAELPVFSKKYHIPYPAVAYFSVIKNRKQLLSIHTHKDCCEIFFCTQGSALHKVNGIVQHVMKGTMVLVREKDIHGFAEPISDDFTIYNLLFDKVLFDETYVYLRGKALQSVMKSSCATVVQIPTIKWTEIEKVMEQMLITKDTEEEYVNFTIRNFVFHMLSTYFAYLETPHKKVDETPFEQILWEMHKPENYIEGLPALQRLFCCCPEHICREFKKRLNKVPTQVITEIRLAEAARMLTTSCDKIIDISNSVGFKSLSHFNHSFKKYYGVSPTDFRKRTRWSTEYNKSIIKDEKEGYCHEENNQ